MTTARRLDGYTLDDWESLDPQEGRRIELVDGRFVVTPAPAYKHQRVGDRLVRILDDAVFSEGMEAVTAVGVRVSEHFGYIPDVVVSTERVETVSVDVANVALVVEIVSPSTKKSDRLEKPAALAAAGVPAYWRVELDGVEGPVIYCHRLNDGVYSDVVTLTPGSQQSVLVAGTISVTFDPADLHKPRR
ncbi:Uma2 family endonuclease [Lentzea aerocolonigenes]|uniref:Uma2 family endonuclease n=1 Tax=Lentzea aerocolonigenes TaxID=68170 RepID=UPI00068975B5|nr:Uma2 family endonuclease [Lentzea aerocolonigenes]MCP2247424.1 Endonuclease, Uma2 family (restriction endonuclease fold) [Lentzea aerocolonigenes]